MNALLDKRVAPQISARQDFRCSGVDLNQAVGFLIEGGNFKVVGPELSRPGFFPSYSFRKLSTDIVLVSFSDNVLQEEVVAALDISALRPAETKELLALAQPNAFPDEQVKGGPILALGSMAQGREGRFVPGLGWSKELGRVLIAYTCQGKWHASCRFAAVRL